jgi:hypothetical protein
VASKRGKLHQCWLVQCFLCENSVELSPMPLPRAQRVLECNGWVEFVFTGWSCKECSALADGAHYVRMKGRHT